MLMINTIILKILNVIYNFFLCSIVLIHVKHINFYAVLTLIAFFPIFLTRRRRFLRNHIRYWPEIFTTYLLPSELQNKRARFFFLFVNFYFLAILVEQNLILKLTIFQDACQEIFLFCKKSGSLIL